jgi:HSP20 family protein
MNNLRKYGLNPLTYRDNFVTSFDNIFDAIIDESFPTLKTEFGIDFSKSSYPKCNIIDHDDSIEIVSEIPGLTKDDVSIKVDEQVLTISGEGRKTDDKGAKGIKFIRRELKHSSFKRSFTLGDTLNLNGISANFENGILSISIEKKEKEVKPIPRNINIK